MKMDCEASGENGEVKINACKRGEAEGDGEQIDSFHGRIYDAVRRLKGLQGYKVEPVVTL
jgi:hypothetical protein